MYEQRLQAKVIICIGIIISYSLDVVSIRVATDITYETTVSQE